MTFLAIAVATAAPLAVLTVLLRLQGRGGSDPEAAAAEELEALRYYG